MTGPIRGSSSTAASTVSSRSALAASSRCSSRRARGRHRYRRRGGRRGADDRGCQCAEHPDTVFYAVDAAENGADAVMVDPLLLPHRQHGSRRTLRTCHERGGHPRLRLPRPGTDGEQTRPGEPDWIAAIDGIAGVKDSSGDVARLGQATDQNPDLTRLAGLDRCCSRGWRL